MNETTFDIYELPDGHQERFLRKLAQRNSQKRKTVVRRMLYLGATAVAASVVLFFGIAQQQVHSLERISPIAYQSEQYYLPIIEQKIEDIKKLEDKRAVQNALLQLERMNENYQHLRQEIIRNGENKQLLAAMMVNFDTQLEFSDEVIAMIR